MSEIKRETNIPCETVRDLFPSYIDGLTGDVTNRLIEEHVADCTACSDILKTMRMPEPEMSDTKKGEGKVLDFLKKNKKRNIRILIGSVAGAIVLALALVYLRLFVVGGEMGGDWIACQVQVNGSQVILDGTPTDSAHCISGVTFTEKDGVVTAHTKAVLASWLHRDGHFHAEYTAKTDGVKQVNINDRILWYDNYQITSLTSEVYQTRHPYMGAMSANARTANALGVSSYLGEYTNELRTSEEPYTWVIRLLEDIPSAEKITKENDMASLAYVMLGVIENLDQVTYEYTVDGQPFTKDVTVEEANLSLGAGVKYCYDNVRELDELISRLRLSVSPSYHDTGAELADGRDHISFTLVFDTKDHVNACTHTLYRDGKVYDQSEWTASLYYGPDSVDRFGYGSPQLADSTLEVGFTVKTTDGKSHDVAGRIPLPSVYGSNTVIQITGSAKDGFTAEAVNTYYFNRG